MSSLHVRLPENVIPSADVIPIIRMLSQVRDAKWLLFVQKMFDNNVGSSLALEHVAQEFFHRRIPYSASKEEPLYPVRWDVSKRG